MAEEKAADAAAAKAAADKKAADAAAAKAAADAAAAKEAADARAAADAAAARAAADAAARAAADAAAAQCSRGSGDGFDAPQDGEPASPDRASRFRLARGGPRAPADAPVPHGLTRFSFRRGPLRRPRAVSFRLQLPRPVAHEAELRRGVEVRGHGVEEALPVSRHGGGPPGRLTSPEDGTRAGPTPIDAPLASRSTAKSFPSGGCSMPIRRSPSQKAPSAPAVETCRFSPRPGNGTT